VQGESISSYIQLRRGLIEHIESGKMSADEFGAYVLIILKADYRTGVWMGSGVALAESLHCEVRKAQHLLRRLTKKGYIASGNNRGTRGNYPIIVQRYFNASKGTYHTQSKDVPNDALMRQKEHTLKEVHLQEVGKKQFSGPAYVGRGPGEDMGFKCHRCREVFRTHGALCSHGCLSKVQ